MKMKMNFVLLVFLMLLCVGCTNHNNKSSLSTQQSSGSLNMVINGIKNDDTETAKFESIINSYYSGKSSRAYKMIKKRIFQNMLVSWTDANLSGIKNPVWNYDSFTQYYILDHDMVSATRNDELYYCTFTADNDKYGYIVLSYNGFGFGIGRVSVEETPYLYDLQSNIDVITTELSKTDIDLSTAVASRIKLVDTKKNRSDEVIRITDDKGNNYICYFEESSITILNHNISSQENNDVI